MIVESVRKVASGVLKKEIRSVFWKPVEIFSVESEVSREVLIKNEGLVGVHFQESLRGFWILCREDLDREGVKVNDVFHVKFIKLNFQTGGMNSDFIRVDVVRGEICWLLNHFDGEFGRIGRVDAVKFDNTALVEMELKD